MTFSKLLMIAEAAGVALATPVFAQQQPRERPCAEHSHVDGQLRGTFGERVIGSGLAANGVLFEIYVGPSGTWTLIVTTPEGSSCLAAAGEAWDPPPEPDLFAAR